MSRAVKNTEIEGEHGQYEQGEAHIKPRARFHSTLSFLKGLVPTPTNEKATPLRQKILP
jgi:hypothetical protein